MVEFAEQGKALNMPRYDLVCADGRLATGVKAEQRPSTYDGVVVVATLPLRGLYRLPLLGRILRNHWAKSQGAILDPSWFEPLSRP